MTTAKEFLFPWPLGDYPEVHSAKRPWLEAVLMGLNSLYGASLTSSRPPTVEQKRVASFIVKSLELFWSWEEKIPASTFKDLFRVKGVDYRGEEIKLARYFNWPCMAAAFPEEVGSLPIEEFCSGGCLSYIHDFKQFLIPEDQKYLGRAPRTMVEDSDWAEVCAGLLRVGICSVLPQSALYHVGGRPLLNGLFAVSKNEVKDGLELHRLIMNMVPLNSLCSGFSGDTCTLPGISGFSAFYLYEGEIAVLASEDIKCFYYLFQIPRSWQRYMGFAREVPRELCPPGHEGWPLPPCIAGITYGVR